MHGDNSNNSMLTCNTKHTIVLYLFNLHFYPFQSASFVGRNCNTCSYVIKSHDEKYWITPCILINIKETLELKPITINSAHHYIWAVLMGSTVKGRFGRWVPEVLHNICNICSRDLPDMSTPTLGLIRA